MNLSMTNCVNEGTDLIARNITGPLWEQLSSASVSRQVLHGHDAITTTFDEIEWMVVTGGYHKENEAEKFHVWLLNLTHADLFGEELWWTMDENNINYTSGASCAVFEYLPTDDPWKRADLWEQSVPCVPTPRHGHVSVILNDELYVFQGASAVNQDYHVYRIHFSEVLSTNWSSWHRIMPRATFNSTSSAGGPLKGGLWYRDEGLPRLAVVAGHSHENPSWQCCEQNHDRVSNQIWVYDFSEDTWELWYELEAIDFDQGVYNAIVAGEYLLVVGSESGDSPLLWMNLETKDIASTWDLEACITPNQTLVMYYDTVTHLALLIGFGPPIPEKFAYEDHSCRKANLGFAVVEYRADGSIEVDRINLHGKSLGPFPHYRSGHTAVLSSVGRMYIFGGMDIPFDREAVWRIDVGGKSCALQIDSSSGFLPDDSPSWYGDDEFSDDDNQGGGGFLFVFFVLFQVGLCFFGNPGSMRMSIDGNVASPRGLSPEQLQGFPERVLSQRDEDALDESAVCSICLLNFCADEVVRDLPCAHVFHKACVDDWLAAESTCPLCRESCSHVVEMEQLERIPSMLIRIFEHLRRNQRQLVDQSDGLEMGNRYSLEVASHEERRESRRQQNHGGGSVTFTRTQSAEIS